MVKKDKIMRRGSMKTQIRVVEGYRPEVGKGTRQRTIKSFGYLEDQEDPEAFLKMVEEYNANYKKEKVPLRIEVTETARMYDRENRQLNYGYKYLEAVFNVLEIESFFKDYEKSHKYRGEYSLVEVFKFLVITRILAPDSIRATSQIKNGFYGMRTDFTLPDVYRSLDHFADIEVELQRHLNERIKAIIGRDLSHAFYDVTNYFFEIDFPDGDEDLRRQGVSKEHRTSPIVAMGLFMDSNGLPVSMSIFPGNTGDTLTLQPTMKDIKASYNLGRIVVVADKGLNSSKNIDTIVKNDDGFVFSQVLRGKKGHRYKDKLLDKNGWTSNEDGTYRYKLFYEEYDGKDKDGKKEMRTRKVLLYWSEAQANMAALKREEKLEKTKRSVKNNAYSIKKGVDEYIKENIIDRGTGELLENTKKLRSIDFEKAENDAMYDGYFCIITSELDYDERKIREVYGGLWRIEQSFRILKTDLYARPVFVTKNEHIRAHFLICFVALLIIRIIQHRMGKSALSAERIATALHVATCKISKNGIVSLEDVGGAIAFIKARNRKGLIVDTLAFSDEDEIAQDYRFIQQTYGIDCYNIHFRQEKFNKFLKTISL